MRRTPSSGVRIQTRRVKPAIEGLEDRRLLSKTALGNSMATAAARTDGVLSPNGTQFTYTTPSGGHAVIHLVGLGNLAGTTVNAAGALNLVYGGTNAYSKITSKVTGGNGRAPLASILNSQLIAAGAQNSLSGVGGNVISAVYLSHFDLIAGGNVNLTPGVITLSLDSIGPDTQIHLRQLPAPPSTSTSTASTATIGIVSSAGLSSSGTLKAVNVNSTPNGTSSSTTTADTLEAGQSTTITYEGVTATYTVGGNGNQTLTALSGSFSAGTNIVESLPAGQPQQTRPPAPPGVIVKVNRVAGSSASNVNLLTDAKIFGYDPTTGDLIRFDLNLNNNTGTVDSTFAPINVPGDPASAGLNLGLNGNQTDVLVSSGTTVYAYNATTGAPVGSFTTSEPVNGIASNETVTILGSYATNQLQMINLAASLQTGVEQPAAGDPAPFTPASGVTLLGGISSSPGSTTVTAAVGAHFDSFQPGQYQLGLQSLDTISVSKSKLSYGLSAASATSLTQGGGYITVQTTPPVANQPGSALGNIDQSLALVLGVTSGTNQVGTAFGTVTLDYPDLLTGLSEAFRADLATSAVIDVQGDVQSVRGASATGLVLNDNGNLNLVQFANVSNSTIVGQPLGHLNIKRRSHVTVLTPSRTAGSRNGVTVESSLQPLGPISQTND
jgi:hypothetical protein